LGDAYNDVGNAAGAPFTVRGTNTVQTVVEQVATYFGVGSVGTPVVGSTYTTLPASGVFSYAVGNALITANTAITTDASLTEQIDRVLADVGTFSSSQDLILLTVGTRDVRAGVNTDTAVSDLMVQLQRLLDAGARHILIMPPIERSGGTYATQSLTFANSLSGKLYDLLVRAPYQGNPIILASGPNPALLTNFNIYTSYTAYGVFTTSTTVAYCPNPTVLTGCTVSDGDGTTYATRLFADDVNLTPAGNQWVALQLYSATAQGWR
jgi:phospholipase/lecithinase/hemolysin